MAVWKTKSGLTFDDSKGAANWYNLNIAGNKQYSDYTYGNKTYVRPDHDMVSLTDKEIKNLIEATVDKQRPLTKAEVASIAGDRSRSETKWAYYHWLLDQNADVLGYDSSVYNKYKAGENGEIDYKRFEADLSAGAINEPAKDPEEAAKEHYYNDLYSLDEGTSGKEMYDRLAEAYLNQAQAQSIMADVQYQNQAMQQAQIVKNITDQIRAERMARLRAGMNEAQIANQDMQMMMANVNALNQNAQMMNQQRLEAQFNMATARDQAYQAYLDQANARGQNAAAFYAADSGNANWNALQYMMMVPGSTYEEALRAVQAMYDDDKKKPN